MSPAIEVTREVNSDRMDGRRKRDTMWVELLDTEAQPARQRSHRWTVGCSSCQGVWGWWRGWGLTELNHKLHPALSDMSKHWVQGPHLTLFQLCCPASTKIEQGLGTSQASIQSRCLPATAHPFPPGTQLRWHHDQYHCHHIPLPLGSRIRSWCPLCPTRSPNILGLMTPPTPSVFWPIQDNVIGCFGGTQIPTFGLTLETTQ